MENEQNKNLIPVGNYEKPVPREQAIELEAYRVNRGGPDEGDAKPAGFSLRDLLYVIFRHRGKILACFIVFLLLTTVYVASVPATYKSSALLLVRPARTDLSVDPTGADVNSLLIGNRYGGPRVAAEIAMLESSQVAERVVDAVGPDRILVQTDKKEPTGVAKTISDFVDRVKAGLNLQEEELSDRAKAIVRVQKSLEIKPAGMRDSNMLEAIFTSHSREVAQEVLDVLVDAYVDEHIKAYGVRISPEVFRREADRLQVQLEQTQDKIQDRLKELNISSIDSQRTMLADQIGTLDATVRELNAQIEASRARMAVLERVLEGRRNETPVEAASAGSAAPQMMSDPLTDRIRQAILELRIQEAELETKYTADSKPLSELRARIQDYETMLVQHAEELAAQAASGEGGATGVTAVNPNAVSLRLQLDNSRADLEAQIARQASLSRELSGLRSDMATLAANEKQLRLLSQQEQALDSKYQRYLNSLQIAEISAALDESNIANVSVMQPATMPIESTKNPRKLLAVLFFGTFFGIGFGIALAYVIEYFDHSLKTNEEVENYLGLPVLVALPKGRKHLPETA